jgi:hypothetical protein
VSFDIPDGKRLVVETVSVQADVPAGQKVRVMLDVLEGISPVLSVMPVQSPGPFLGVEYYVANLPFKLRKDAMPGTTDEIRVRMIRDSSAGDAGLAATIHISGRSLIDVGVRDAAAGESRGDGVRRSGASEKRHGVERRSAGHRGPFTPLMDFVVRADATGLPYGQELRPQFAALDVVEA